MSDPKVEERARKLLKPHVFRVGQRRADLGGIRVESSAVDYWEAVHVVADLLTKLDEAEERERALIAGVREVLDKLALPYPGQSTYSPLNSGADWAPRVADARAILSRLLSSTPKGGGQDAL